MIFEPGQGDLSRFASGEYDGKIRGHENPANIWVARWEKLSYSRKRQKKTGKSGICAKSGKKSGKTGGWESE